MAAARSEAEGLARGWLSAAVVRAPKQQYAGAPFYAACSCTCDPCDSETPMFFFDTLSGDGVPACAIVPLSVAVPIRAASRNWIGACPVWVLSVTSYGRSILIARVLPLVSSDYS